MSYLDEFWMFGMLGLTIWPLALSRPRLPGGGGAGGLGSCRLAVHVFSRDQLR